jgi:hypothetical protein
MEQYWADVSGLLLRVRKIETGWEASVVWSATAMDEETAKGEAVKFASSVTGKEAGRVEWNAGPKIISR